MEAPLGKVTLTVGAVREEVWVVIDEDNHVDLQC
jgi:hypothetical protein